MTAEHNSIGGTSHAAEKRLEFPRDINSSVRKLHRKVSGSHCCNSCSRIEFPPVFIHIVNRKNAHVNSTRSEFMAAGGSSTDLHHGGFLKYVVNF